MSGPILLASASPRRREILRALGVPFEVHAVEIDERPLPGEAPRAYVSRIARDKRLAARAGRPTGAILAADTTVTIDGAVLGKPLGEADACAMLARLAGRTHEVFTAISIEFDGRAHEENVATEVEFAPLDRRTIERYVATGEGRDKAGSYAIQGIGGGFVTRIVGSYSNVVGLPAHETVKALVRLGAVPGWP
jgi:septum formation protein